MRRHLPSRTMAILAAALALGLLSACSPDETVDATSPTEPGPTTIAVFTPVTTHLRPTGAPYGGTLRVGMAVDLVSKIVDASGNELEPTLNPLLGDPLAYDLARLVVPGAFRIDAATGELTPWLVESIPRLENGGVVVADDGSATVTYRVRDEAVWEDGTPVTGEDLAFTHRLITDLFDAPEQADWSPHGLLDTSSIVVDGKAFTARLAEPNPRYEKLFEWVLPAHLIDPQTFTEDWNDRLWPSAGPFRFVSNDPADPESAASTVRVIVLEHNPAYWETDPESGDILPYLDRIEVFTFAAVSPGTVAHWMRSGDGDAVLSDVFPIGSEELVDDMTAAGVTAALGWDTLLEVLFFNLGEGRLKANPDSGIDQLAYRQAILSAIDRSALASSMGSEPIDSLLGITFDHLDHDAWAKYDDPAAVSGYLDDVVGEPKALYRVNPAPVAEQIGNDLVDRLNEAGLDASAEFPPGYFTTNFTEGLVDLYGARFFAGLGGLSGVVDALALFGPDPRLARWSAAGEAAARYGEVIAAAEAELDPARLVQLIEEAETILADNAVLYPLVRRQGSYRVYRPDRIEGIAPNRIQGWDTWNAAWWKTP